MQKQDAPDSPLDAAASPLDGLDSPLNFEPGKKNEFDLNVLPPAPRKVSLLAILTLLLRSKFWLVFLACSLTVPLVLGTSAALYNDFGVWEPYATGRVVSCDTTGASIGEDECLAIAFEGLSPDGETFFTGVSYSFCAYDSGDDVMIERRRGSTDVLRVQGASLAKFGTARDQLPAIAAILILVGVGAAVAVIYPLCVAIPTIKTLKHGEIAYGSLAEIRQTNVSVNGVPVSALTFNYVTKSLEELVVKVKTLRPEDFQDLPNYPLLYLPERPQKAILLNSLPKGIKLEPNVGFVAKLWPLIPHILLLAVIVLEVVMFCNVPNKNHRALFSSESAAEAAGVGGDYGDDEDYDADEEQAPSFDTDEDYDADEELEPSIDLEDGDY